MSYSAGYSNLIPISFALLQYRDISGGVIAENEPPELGAMAHTVKRRVEVEMTEAELAARIRQERADAAAQAEQKLRQEYEQKLAAARAPIAAAVSGFA